MRCLLLSGEINGRVTTEPTAPTDLGEIADNMRALLVNLTQDVEQERLHVKIQGLVVQKQLGQQAQILAWWAEGGG